MVIITRGGVFTACSRCQLKCHKCCFTLSSSSCLLPGPALPPVQLAVPHEAQPASASASAAPHQNPHIPPADQPQSPPILLLWCFLLVLHLLHPSLAAPASRDPDSHHGNHSSHCSSHSGPDVQRHVPASWLSCRHGDHQTGGQRSDAGGAAAAEDLAQRGETRPR